MCVLYTRLRHMCVYVYPCVSVRGSHVSVKDSGVCYAPGPDACRPYRRTDPFSVSEEDREDDGVEDVRCLGADRCEGRAPSSPRSRRPSSPTSHPRPPTDPRDIRPKKGRSV